LDQAAQQGHGSRFELGKAHRERRACRARKDALDKERGIAAQLKNNLKDVAECMMVADDSTDPGRVAAVDVGNLTDELFEVLAELTPLPMPATATPSPVTVTTLNGLSPDMERLVKLKVQQEMEKKREAIYAEGVAFGANMQQKQQQSPTAGAEMQMQQQQQGNSTCPQQLAICYDDAASDGCSTDKSWTKEEGGC